MMGDLYMALAKILILMFSLVVVYILLIQKDEEFYFQNIINLVIPLLVLFNLYLVNFNGK
jgi:hypothetical protein